MTRLLMIRIALVALALTSTLPLPLKVYAQTNVPTEFQKLYSTLKTSLDNYDTYLDSHQTGNAFPVIFGGELLPANSNRGPDLLRPETMQSVTTFLNRLQELGVKSMTVTVGYPLYTPKFPRYQEYVQFYKQLAAEVRKRALRLDVEAQVILVNAPDSSLQTGYTGLTFDKYAADKKQMIAAIISDIHPDYLNIGAEPDTESALLGLKELNEPEKYVDYVNHLLAGLDRAKTQIGAGIGTWGNIEYVQKFAANTTLDFIDMHVYPVTGPYLQNIIRIADVAKQQGKKVVIDEAWLYKDDNSTTGAPDNAAEIFRRGVFSFWTPLDQEFLQVLAKLARSQNIEYVSPFWTTFFFGYVDYDANTANLPYDQLAANINMVVAKNVLDDKFTSTGEYYRKIVASETSITSGTVATTRLTAVSTKTERATGGMLPELLVVVVVAAIAISIAISFLIRRRMSKRS